MCGAGKRGLILWGTILYIKYTLLKTVVSAQNSITEAIHRVYIILTLILALIDYHIVCLTRMTVTTVSLK